MIKKDNFELNLNIYFLINYQRPCVRINCYKNVDWPNANKDEIDNAIKNCLEVFFFYFCLSRFKISLLKILININLKKKLDSKNKELDGVFNNRYKMIKKLGEGAQGTVYEIEDLAEDRKR